MNEGSFEECAHVCGCPDFEQGLFKFIAETPKYCNEYCDYECGAPSALNLVCNESCHKKCTDIYDPSKSERVVLHSKVLSFPPSGLEISLIDSIMKSIDKLNVPLPAKFEDLATATATNTKFGTDQCTPELVPAILKKWNLPTEVYNFMLQISFSEVAVYKTYHFVVKDGIAHLDEYVASAKNINNVVTMAYM
jgi:hypothetical protein